MRHSFSLSPARRVHTAATVAYVLSLWFGGCTLDLDRAASTVTTIFTGYEATTCYDSADPARELDACRDESGQLLLAPERTIKLSQENDVDRAIAKLRQTFQSHGCENLWSDFPEAYRYMSTWQGSIYFDAFECSGLALTVGTSIDDDGRVEVVLKVHDSSREIRATSPLEWTVTPSPDVSDAP